MSNNSAQQLREIVAKAIESAPMFPTIPEHVRRTLANPEYPDQRGDSGVVWVNDDVATEPAALGIHSPRLRAIVRVFIGWLAGLAAVKGDAERVDHTR